MKRRDFIKRGALFVPTIFIPRLIRAQTILTADGLAALGANAATGGGGGGTTSYANTGGTGDRQVIIAATMNGSSAGWLVNGDTTSNGQGFFNGSAASGQTLQFDFGSGNSVKIDEAKYYQQTSDAQGTWKFQGSNDASSWTDIGSSFSLGGTTTQTITAINGNTSSYRYYRMIGVSGNTSSNPWVYEVEFKIFGL